MGQYYTDEEANAILRRAVEQQPLGNEMTREQLEAITTELGITPEALARAEAEYREEQREQSLRAAFDAERRVALRGHKAPLVGVGAGISLVMILLGTAALSGLVTLLLVLTVFATLAVAARMVLAPQFGQEREKRFQEWLEERERAALR